MPPRFDSDCWTSFALNNLIEELGISESYAEAYEPLIPRNHATMTPEEEINRLEIINSFLLILTAENKRDLSLIIELMIFLLLHRILDGRGRVLIRNLTRYIPCTTQERIAAEYILWKLLFVCNNELTHKITKQTKRKKMIRYAQIGAVSVGAGALLAVTGGLAAPAIAGAIAVMGSSSAAAVLSVGVVAGLFGSAGAGLAGYKMLKRTRGIEEFEFETNDDEKGQLNIMILVSGWMYNPEDYKRSFGVLPDKMSMLERISRFYMQHCPDRLKFATDEAEMFGRNPDVLYAHLQSSHNRNPLRRSDLRPPLPRYSFDESQLRISIRDLLCRQINLMHKVNLDTAKISEEVQDLDDGDDIDDNEVENAAAEGIPSDQHDTGPSTRPAAASSWTSRWTPRLPTFSSQKAKSDGSKSATESSTKVSKATTLNSVECPSNEVESIADETSNYEQSSLFGNKYWDWRDLNISAVYEPYLLRWETATQLKLGHQVQDFVNTLGQSAAQQVIATAFFAALAAAVTLPAVALMTTQFIDSTWTVAILKADRAGKELARALIARQSDGDRRGITLVGYSIGARVIYSCLKELARIRFGATVVVEATDVDNEDESEKVDTTSVADESTAGDTEDTPVLDADGCRYIDGLIQDVVLLGAPVSNKSQYWSAVRTIVNGRLINGYAPQDMMLGVIYRCYRGRVNIAGISPVESCEGIDNIDLSHIVTQHIDYCRNMKEILQHIDLLSP